MTFDEWFVKYPLPAEIDTMDDTDREQWTWALRSAYKTGAASTRLQSLETESKERILRLEGALTKEVTINAQLLEALRFIADRQDLMFAECSDAEEIIEVARAAIKTAKGEA